MSDAINPSHYRSASGLESIDFIEAFVPTKPHRWPAMKYLIRAGKKPGQDEAQDLRKAIWWIEREIAAIESSKQAALEAHIASVADRFPDACPDLDQEYPLTSIAAINGTDDDGVAEPYSRGSMPPVTRGSRPWSFPGA